LPNDDSKGEFLQRLRNGYLLNDLGLGSTDIVRGFDLEEEVVSMLETKSTFGQHMHSDYCRLEGRTINDWLATPGQSRELLQALEDRGWIKRNQDPQDSRFWQLIDGPGAVMFGVFSGYEMQLLKDWIAGEWQASGQSSPFRTRFRRRHVATADAAQSHNPPSLPFDKLVELIAPDSHPTPEGLAATRLYARQLAQGGLSR
jgi:hypothetical protein